MCNLKKKQTGPLFRVICFRIMIVTCERQTEIGMKD